MSKKEKKNTRGAAIICGCLCLLAVGAGVVWQATDYKDTLPMTAQEGEGDQIQPVTISQSPTVDETLLKKEEPSNDPGEAPVSTANAAVQTTVQKIEKKAAEPVFSYPVQGEVVLSYSPDSAIYDPTLEQYRTNDGVSIAAEKGVAVKAAAKGTVKEVTKNEVSGNTVVMEHENGWLTTYSQLAETIPVKQGQTVDKGETIGVVGNPTKYSVALGEHVDFSLEKNGETQDPEKTVTK